MYIYIYIYIDIIYIYILYLESKINKNVGPIEKDDVFGENPGFWISLGKVICFYLKAIYGQKNVQITNAIL